MPASPERRFARLRDAPGDPRGFAPLPDDGMCLSVYVLLSPADRPGRVLLGRPNPDGPWGSIGAMDRRRVEAIDAWMLPACHLQMFEAPHASAQRIVREQLGLARLALDGPEVYSEAYHRGGATRDPHWDLQFVYSGTLATLPPGAPNAWHQLEFLDVGPLPDSAFARGHGDILRLAGRRRARGTT